MTQAERNVIAKEKAAQFNDSAARLKIYWFADD